LGKEFLLEIGTEEIPSRFINPALEKMKELFAALLASGRIASRGEMTAYGTPRRLALHVPDLDEVQTDVSKEVTGPPRKVAFDAEGKPTRAATVFAEKNGIPVSELTVKATDKGEYMVARIDEKGGDTAVWLKQVLPGFILSIPFSKSMRWMDKDTALPGPSTGC
jgi:glycyl-tRNA synthetase beta chain